jgi:tetratricopeptide (TPR) repeat protein
MFAFQTPLRRTVSLVEERLRDNSSSDPIKDLAFLSDHYAKKNEWDKANAATRHMLAVAEGSSDSSFKTTPLDIELQLNRKFLNGKKQGRNLLRFFVISILSLFVLIIGVQLKNDPKVALDLYAQILAVDPQSFVDRADYFLNRGQLPEALADIDKALAIDPNYSKALYQKSVCLYLQGRYAESLKINELGHHDTSYYYWNKYRGYAALGDLSSATNALHGADAINHSNQDKYEVAITAARAGDYEKSLQFAQLITLEASSNYDKAEGLASEARYLLKLSRYDEAIEASTKCINIHSYPWTSRAYTYRAEAKYQLARYEEAVSDASSAISLNTNNFRAYTIRAKCFEMLGRNVDAQADRRNADFERNSLDL